MENECEMLSKKELQELDALLTKLMLYLHSFIDSEVADKIPRFIFDTKNTPTEEELIRRF